MILSNKSKLYETYYNFHNELEKQVTKMVELQSSFIEYSNGTSRDINYLNKLYHEMNEQYELLKPIMIPLIKNGNYAQECMDSQEDLYKQIERSQDIHGNKKTR